MRYLVGFVFVLALMASPLSVRAQDAEEAATAEPGAQEPAPEEPALQLQLDKSGVEVVPSPPWTPDGYTLEEMNVRVKRAKIGVGVSAVPILIGGLLAGGSDFVNAYSFEPNTPEEEARRKRLLGTGIAFMGVGAASMIATGILLGVRKRKRRELQQAHYETPRRVQWDLARSRLVF